MFDLLKRRWLGATVLGWIAIAAVLIFLRWGAVHWFALGDTDDHMRMMQVRDLLKGQDWYDLRQYRLNPPEGFDMHWSRLVDLPIAALILVARLFVPGGQAERFAIMIAPLLPLLIVSVSLASIMRRLASPLAYLPVIFCLLFTQALLGMFAPTRLDHHGWQLAMLSLMAFGLVDEKKARGGLMIGGAMAASFAIGIELLPYTALVGALAVGRWIIDPEEGDRLLRLGMALGVGSIIGYFGFASYANAAPRCDALTPVWFSVLLAAAFVAFSLSRMTAEDWRLRLCAAVVGGLTIAGLYALLWPQCVGRLEGVSPELQRSWLDKVSEARPIYQQAAGDIASFAVLPVTSLFGYALTLWTFRADRQKLIRWASLALLSFVATALLLFQTRVAASAQLLALPGTVMLGWILVPRFAASKVMLVRVFGITSAAFLASGALGPLLDKQLSKPAQSAMKSAKPTARQMSARCSTLPALRSIALLPKATMFTLVDFGPRLITVTHHNAIAGPYHRNGNAILDVHHVFDGTPEQALPIIKRHGASYVLVCPGQPEGTQYAWRSPNGFYSQLVAGKVPDWLEPVKLPGHSPLLLWRVKP